MEKAVKGLECCITMPDIYPHCEECPYADEEGMCVDMDELHRDALALLKAQEPVEYVVHCKNADFSNGTEFACGECGGSLLHKKVNYCPWCGKKVKWE